MQFWYVAPWRFSNLGNLTGAAQGRMRDGKSMEITDDIPVWSLGCSRSTAVFIVVELVWSKKVFLQVELGVLSAMKWRAQKNKISESRLVPGPSKGCQMVLRGVNSPSLRVYLAPLGRCWSVLRCFEIPLPETELRKGRELLAKRGEQKIRKNQVQAIRHSGHSLVVVATRESWGTGQDCQHINNHSELSDTNFSNSNSACDLKCFFVVFFFFGGGAGMRNGQDWWFGSTLFCSDLLWQAFEGMFECSHMVPGWNDEGKEEAYRREEDIWKIEGPNMCPTYCQINGHKCCWGLDIAHQLAHHSATCSTICYDYNAGALQKPCGLACSLSMWIDCRLWNCRRR